MQELCGLSLYLFGDYQITVWGETCAKLEQLEHLRSEIPPAAHDHPY